MAVVPPKTSNHNVAARIFFFRLALAVLFLNLFVAGLVGFFLYESWQQYESRTAIQVQNLSQSVSLTIGSILEKTDIALYSVKRELEREIRSGTVDAGFLNSFIHDEARLIAELDGLRIVNSQGDFVYGHETVSKVPINIADRDYFRQVRENPDSGLIISKPLLARSSNKWVFNLVRRIDNPDGSFAGAVIGAISLDYINNLFSSFDLGKQGVVMLRDGELVVMARYPEPPGVTSSTGNMVVSRQLAALVNGGKTSGTYKNPGSIDPVQRTFSFNKISGYPLYVTVGLASSDYLAPWRTEATIILAVLGLFSSGSLLSALFMYRSQKRKLIAEDELLQHRDHLEETVRQRTFELESNNARLAREIFLRKKADDELRKAAIVMERMSDAVEWIARDGRYLYVNEASCRIHGYTRDELLSMSVSQVAPQMPPERWDAHWEELKREGCLHLETFNKTKDGYNTPIEVTANYLEIDGVGYNCVIVRDISYRKEVEAEKQNLLMQLSQSQKIESIGRLAGGIAHDFNNLLMPIMGYAEMVQAHLSPESSDYRKVENIVQAAEKAKVLTQQLLSFGRKQLLEMKTIDINSVIESFYEICRRTIRESITIRLHLSQTIHGIRADRNQVEQIILNLAINAQDAIHDKGTITIETAPVVLDENYARRHAGVTPGNYMMLAVSDSGSGMNRETLGKIFEPFFTTKALGRGSGLGLATVYGIVKQHEGHIWVYSEIGKGTVFKIYFPIVNQAPAIEAAGVSEPLKKSEGDDYSILLVEDDEMVKSIVHDALIGYGCSVIVTGSPSEALEISKGREIHLLLTDVIMPEMNGPELHRKMVADHPGLKVLFMSGYTDSIIGHQGVLEEGINFIQKPFAIKDLMLKIRMIIEENHGCGRQPL